jgi:hypothetical protein
MPVTWKNSSRFRPAVILERIQTFRIVNPSGPASFGGFELEQCLPALQSMLKFPPVASEVDSANLVWRAIAKVEGDLTPQAVLTAINRELGEKLRSKESNFYLLTTISIDINTLPKQVTINGTTVRYSRASFPKRFQAPRINLIKSHEVPIIQESAGYTTLIAKVKAKTPASAFQKALRAIDIQRALWCLMGNSRMELTFSGVTHEPINAIRLGSRHTLHLPNGESAYNGIWFEPNFREARIYKFKKPEIVVSNSRRALQQLNRCAYSETLTKSLLRFVRALDDADPNTAFLRLWGAVEALTTPNRADYDLLVTRCAFLFRENKYHQQILEHLREYRNTTVHAGEESDRARTHCYQLQLYFVNLFWFHLRNSSFFSSLDEANRFLDLSPEQSELLRQGQLIKRAVKFIG